MTPQINLRGLNRKTTPPTSGGAFGDKSVFAQDDVEDYHPQTHFEAATHRFTVQPFPHVRGWRVFAGVFIYLLIGLAGD
jgi:hypothetical protein